MRRGRAIAVLSIAVPIALMLAPDSSHAQAVRDPLCDSLQASARQRSDSILATPRARWRPATSDVQERSAIDMAHVIFQVRVDTMGRPEPRTFVVRRSADAVFERLARSQLTDLDFPPEEPVPGCRVVFVATVPLRFSR